MALLPSLLRPILRYWGRNAAPKTHGTLVIPGLEAQVRVRWDPYAIPHVYAASEHDLFLAQGYLHAQERLWQMDSTRRFLCGRLAEILGEREVPGGELSVRFRDKSSVEMDYFMRIMGIRRAACASLRILPQESVDRLLAYSQGVNRYIETHLNSLPLEFRLLRCQPGPWLPEDCLTIGKGFALFLSSSLFTRLTWSALAKKLKGREAKLASLAPHPAAGPTITDCAADQAASILRFIGGTFQRSDWALGGQGSNNWVVAAGRSSTGKPILCSDPHLRMTLPSVWYLMHLKSAEEFEVWGGSIPGSPCVHIGHNRHIAWGVTAGLCDDGELYREKLHAQEADLYLVGSRWEKMASEEEQITIRGAAAVTKRIRFTRHGPLISDFAPLRVGDTSEALAFKWTAHEPSEEMRCLYGVNRARNWKEFLDGLSCQTAPSLNYVYADTAGNIGYSLAGKIPLRPTSPSFLPLPGWDETFEWKGYIPFAELPRLYNPPEGAIATANNRVAGAAYPYYLSALFEPSYRIRRIRDLLTANEKLSPEDMAHMQKDAVSLHGRETVSILRADLEKIAEPSLREMAERLCGWDGDCREESLEAALFHLFYERLARNLLVQDLGEELYAAYTELFNQALAPVEGILKDSQAAWFASRSRSELVEQSLRESQASLKQRLGADRRKWHWGRLHTLTLHHAFDRIRILASLFSLGPFPSPGDAVTVNMGFYRHSNPFRHVVGPSMRMIADLGDWRKGRFILASGQSGHCFSPHYGDQTELWRRGSYVPLCHDERSMERWPVLLLEPALTGKRPVP